MANPFNPARGKNTSLIGGGGFNKQAAGSKAYGGGRPFPNSGKTSAAGKIGYNERDARRNAILKRQGRV